MEETSKKKTKRRNAEETSKRIVILIVVVSQILMTEVWPKAVTQKLSEEVTNEIEPKAEIEEKDENISNFMTDENSNAPVIEKTATHTVHKVVNMDQITSCTTITVHTTAYCACEKCCGRKSDSSLIGVTASGTKATEGRTIAVDTRIIPLGSKVVIDGFEYIAEDTGSAIKGNKIDLYMNNHEIAKEWGVQEKTVYIIS